MKIAFVVHGACPSSVEELAAALVRARHEVRLFSDRPFERRRPDGVERVAIEPSVGVPALTHARMLGQDIAWRLRDGETQLIHAFGTVAGISAQVAARDELPVVQTVGHLALTERRLGAMSPALSGRMLLERRLLERAAMVVASGPDQAMEILRTGLAPERVVTVAPGIDPQRYPVTPLPRRTGHRAWRILHPGGTREDSGLPEVLAALSTLRHAQLTVLGARDEDAEWVRVAAHRWQVGARIALRPRVPASAMPGMYVAADLVVAAPRQLASGRVALEAMSSARPLVVSSCGAMLDVVEDGVTGFVAPPRDAGGLAAALRRAIHAPRAELEELAERAGTRVRAEHTWQQRIPHLMAVYEHITQAEDHARQRRAELRTLVTA